LEKLFDSWLSKKDIKSAHMKQLKISKAFMLMESGPVVLITTNDGKKDNIMTIS
jgi:flavin reductase (DIM6/NTAB) family NADH-FMN oxidoreductase RutF